MSIFKWNERFAGCGRRGDREARLTVVPVPLLASRSKRHGWLLWVRQYLERRPRPRLALSQSWSARPEIRGQNFFQKPARKWWLPLRPNRRPTRLCFPLCGEGDLGSIRLPVGPVDPPQRGASFRNLSLSRKNLALCFEPVRRGGPAQGVAEALRKSAARNATSGIFLVPKESWTRRWQGGTN